MNQPILTSEIRQTIISMVSNHWALNKSPMLLARLGQLLSRSGFDLAQVFRGSKMAKVLEEECSDALKVDPLPENPTIFVVTPRNAGPAAEHAIHTLDQQPKATKIVDIPRYNKALWAAFTWQVPPGKKRTLSINPVEFIDIDINANMPAGKWQISSGHIVTKTAGISPKEHQRLVGEAIAKWLAETGIKQEDVLASTTFRKESDSTGTLLDRLIASLSTEQLQRVSLPLDVIASLLKS